MDSSEISILQWVYERMIEIHGENKNYDYMVAFKNVIDKAVDSDAELYECEGVKKMFDDAAMLFEYERRKEQDPTFALTLDEFAVLWRAKEKPQVCEHGSLKRQCLICELQAENAILNRMVEAIIDQLAPHGKCPFTYNYGLRYSHVWSAKCDDCMHDRIKRDAQKCWTEYFRLPAEREDGQ